MLEIGQEALLTKLVQASRSRAELDRATFHTVREFGKAFSNVLHPGLPGQSVEAFPTDLRILAQDGYLIVLQPGSSGTDEFDLTTLGFKYIEESSRPGAAMIERKRWGKWVAVDEKPFKHTNMSNIWRARPAAEPQGTMRALKELKYKKGRSSTAYRRFVREIQILSEKLGAGHPHIISAIDYAVPLEGDTTDPYVVMELAQGNLREAAKTLKGHLEAILQLFLPITDALHAAHEAGVIHRDVKPDNILLIGDSHSPAVCDFGIAFLEDDARLTRTEADTLGTDAFVAPELQGGGHVDSITPAADVYSLGKTIYAVVSGGEIFPRERWVDQRFDLASRFNDKRLAHVRGLMEAMVQENPANRLQTMADVRRLLEHALTSVRDSVEFREGMYTNEGAPLLRLTQVRTLLRQPETVARGDAIRQAMLDAMRSAAEKGSEYAKRPDRPPFQGQIHESASVAAVAAEELMSACLPLVEADERDSFEEWLAEVSDGISRSDGYQHAPERLISSLAGVTAANGAAALAWSRRRLELLRLILDRYVANASRWTHHSALTDKSSAVIPWMTKTIQESSVVAKIDSQLAHDPLPALAFVHGIVTVRALLACDAERLRRFMDGQMGTDFPVPFVPGLTETSWVATLLDIGLKGGPVERNVARLLFDSTAEEFRQTIARLSPALEALSTEASRRLGRMPRHKLGVDPRAWMEWCGGRL